MLVGLLCTQVATAQDTIPDRWEERYRASTGY